MGMEQVPEEKLHLREYMNGKSLDGLSSLSLAELNRLMKKEIRALEKRIKYYQRKKKERTELLKAAEGGQVDAQNDCNEIVDGGAKNGVGEDNQK